MIIVFSTFPDLVSAEKAASLVIEKEFGACVNLLSISKSFYKWEGKLQIHPEFLLLIKTTKRAYTQLEILLKQNNPNKVPEIIYFEIKGGNDEYLSWIQSSVLSKLLSVPLDLSAIKRIGTPLRESTSAKKPSTLFR